MSAARYPLPPELELRLTREVSFRARVLLEALAENVPEIDARPIASEALQALRGAMEHLEAQVREAMMPPVQIHMAPMPGTPRVIGERLSQMVREESADMKRAAARARLEADAHVEELARVAADLARERDLLREHVGALERLVARQLGLPGFEVFGRAAAAVLRRFR